MNANLKQVLLGAAATLVVVGIAYGVYVFFIQTNTALISAHDACDAGELEDDDQTLIVLATNFDDEDLDSYEDLLCVFDELDAPRSVTAHLEDTSASDGRQTDDWEGIEASWTYHPDNGANVIFEIAD